MRWLSAVFLFVLTSSVSAHDVDLTKLPLGDGKLSAAPTIGQIWACRVDPNGGGAQVDGPWIDKANGTFDYTKKAVVSGHVMWTPHFVMSFEGDNRVFTSNDLPNHPSLSRQGHSWVHRSPDLKSLLLRVCTLLTGEGMLHSRKRRHS